MALLEDTLFGDLFNLNSNVEVPKRVGLGFSYPDIQVMDGQSEELQSKVREDITI